MLQPDPKLLSPPVKPGESASGRETKRAALLDEAAQELNARGISGASIARIAKRVGLTRAAVYYYFKDRDELAAECYRRTCRSMAEDMAAALRVKGNGLEKVLDFLRRALDSARAPCAALSELDYFAGRTRDAIAAAHSANVSALRGLICAGISDGSIRPCDDEIVAQTLIGTITWIPLSVGWVEGTDEGFRARTVDAFADLIVNGQARDPFYAFVPPVAIESFFPSPTDVFDRRALADAKIERLLMIASQLFNRHGIDGTSLDDIARGLGATKGTLYHYLEHKMDLVVRCYKRATMLFDRFAEASEKVGRTGLERGLIGLYLNVQAHASGLSPLIQLAGPSALPAAARRELRRRSRGLQRRFESFGKQGLADGSLRPMDYDAVAQLGAGAFEWLPKWFSFDDTRAPRALAEEIVALFIRGLRTR
jgi:AcrR family transcriptional regulator